ncbi:MAG: hypothetical protein ABW168_28165 [Sedimenticola sp.]
MSKKKGGTKKRAKLEKKLANRLMHDFEKLLSLGVSSGSLTQESIVTLLKGMTDALSKTTVDHNTGKYLRKPGRFLENLHKARKEVVRNGEFAKEDHDIKSLALIQRMVKKGKSEDEIAVKMRKLGNRITAEGIHRVLSKKPKEAE